MTKEELKIIALTQRIGEITSQFEENIADIRADYTLLKNELEALKAKHEAQDFEDGPGE